MNNTIPATRNSGWGFFGTIRNDTDPERAWNIALPAIANATGCAETAVRDFLDSRYGRHFADEVANGLFRGLSLDAAIDAAIARWMGRRIGRRTARETGIPHDLPYLTGFVAHAEIEAEMVA
jgi:hypothetical protein